MPPIGETLREARMRQGLDIADVESRTKIRAKYLRALESEDWALLPGSTFVRTFLRTYAEVVGLDPHALVEEYRAAHEPRDEAELQPLAQGGRAGGAGRERRRRTRGGGPPPRWPLFAAAAAAVVAFLLVLGLVGGNGNDSPTTTQARPQTATTPARRRPARRRPAARAGVTVRVAPSAPTYACVDTGPGTPVVFQGTLDAPRSFRDARMIRVNLGRRSIDLRANGRRVAIAPGPQPVGYAITPSAARELPLGQRPCA